MNDNNLQNNTNSDNHQQIDQNGGLDDLILTDEELDGIKGGVRDGCRDLLIFNVNGSTT